MRIFFLSKQGIRDLRRGFMQRTGIIISIVLGISVWISTSQMVRLDLLQYIWSLLLVIIITLALFTFSSFRALAQFQKIWESIEIEIGDQYVARRQVNVGEIRLNREEIVTIQETKRGLIIYSVGKSRSLFIPVQLEGHGYEEVKSTLSAWTPLQEVSSQGKARRIFWVVLFLLGYTIVLLSWSRWLTLFVSLAMTAVLTYFYWLRRHSEQVVSQLKRGYIRVVVSLVIITAIKFTPVFQEYSQFVRSLFFLYE